ncbi:pyridoxamine 5'-phosphate oxidase family protein [Streptomyces sp. enrichment culture]|uniref:pyridoxamine 5'-phosphate oxidase family protein n=1 Tax=Streptomyces sp. enrichment culture TaxID=1795815 RepID=UPI003F563EEA
MKITDAPRDIAARRQDVLHRLERETDVWVASAGADGVPCLVPLWFAWDGTDVWLATRPGNPTGRNLEAGGRTRLALADTQDVVLIDGSVRIYGAADVPAAAAEAFAAKHGWDPRGERAAYAFFRVRPVAVQSWHGVRELPGRHLMRDGVWLG